MKTYDVSGRVLGGRLAPEASLGDAVAWAVAHALLAPSPHNSQPWLFRVAVEQPSTTAQVSVVLDTGRVLTAVDPQAREAVLACGAALLNLRLALTGAGLVTSVQLEPDPAEPDLLALVTVRPGGIENEADRDLRRAIPFRGTHRARFDAAAVPGAVVDQLVADAAREGAVVTVVDGADRRAVTLLDARAARRLWLDAAYRRDVARWSRANGSGRRDGVPGAARGLGVVGSALLSAQARAGLGTVLADEGSEGLADAPLLLLLSSAGASRSAWVRVGAGLERLLLRATSAGLAASYCNNALRIPELRLAVGRIVGVDHPQVLLRMGYAPLDRPLPRRRGTEVLELTPDVGPALT